MSFPKYTKTFHHDTYPAIDPSRPESSTAGKVVVITGAGSGMGKRMCNAFAVSGCTKIAILGRTASTLEETKKEVEGRFDRMAMRVYSEVVLTSSNDQLHENGH